MFDASIERHATPAFPSFVDAAPTGACAALEEESFCLPCTLARMEGTAAGPVRRRRIRRREALFRQGDDFQGLYAVVAGSLKSVLHADEGTEQVAGFHVSGDLVGLDALAWRRHESAAIALEDTELVALPFGEPGQGGAALATSLARLLSREVVRERRHMMVLNQRSAEARVAAFLLDMSQRMEARGYSPAEFHLRMTREEIGSYLRLNLETVSRAFGRLRRQGLVVPEGKHVRLTDVPRLKLAALPARH